MGTVDPAGSYDLQLTFGGTALPIKMELYKENGAWHGSAGNPSVGVADVINVKVDGSRFRVTLTAQNNTTFALSFELRPDNTVTGTWEGNGDGSPVTGRKIK
jgi:hypothetical protein